MGSTPNLTIAALYDIHGNLPALDAALADADALGFDALVIGGDVATGYMPVETIERLMSLGTATRYVMGNADRDLVRVFDGEPSPQAFPGELTAWCARRLKAVHRNFLAGFEPTVQIGNALFCHGTPRSADEILTPVTPDEVLTEALGNVDAEIVIGGHTHIQMDRRSGHLRFVNAGSVGMPYGGTGAFWLRVATDVEFRRSYYDLEQTAAAIRATGGPGADEFATENILATPSAEEAAEIFERQAGRS